MKCFNSYVQHCNPAYCTACVGAKKLEIQDVFKGLQWAPKFSWRVTHSLFVFVITNKLIFGIIVTLDGKLL